MKVRGFTLLEVIIVVSILGVILLLAIPQYNTYEAKENLREAAALVQSIVQRAETDAQKTGISARIYYNPNYVNELALIDAHGALLFSSPAPAGITFEVFATRHTNSNPQVTMTCTGAVMIQLPAQDVGSYKEGIAFDPSGGNPVFCRSGYGMYKSGPTPYFMIQVGNTRSEDLTISLDPTTGSVSMGQLTQGITGGAAVP